MRETEPLESRLAHALDGEDGAYRIVTLRSSVPRPLTDTLSVIRSVLAFALANRRAVARDGLSRSESSLPVVQLRRRAATVRVPSLSRLAAFDVTLRVARPLPVLSHDSVTFRPRARNARTEDGTTSSACAPRTPPCTAGPTVTWTVAVPVAPWASLTVTFAV